MKSFIKETKEYFILIMIIMIITWMGNGFKFDGNFVQLFMGITACTALMRTCGK